MLCYCAGKKQRIAAIADDAQHRARKSSSASLFFTSATRSTDRWAHEHNAIDVNQSSYAGIFLSNADNNRCRPEEYARSRRRELPRIPINRPHVSLLVAVDHTSFYCRFAKMVAFSGSLLGVLVASFLADAALALAHPSTYVSSPLHC